MALPPHFALFGSGQHIFTRFSNCFHPAVHFIICNMVFVQNLEDASKAPHLHGLYSFLQIMSEGPCFACIEKKTDNTSVHISLIFVLRDMFLSFQMILSWDIACVACAILDRISGFEPSSVTVTPSYLNWLTVSSLLSLILMSPLMP